MIDQAVLQAIARRIAKHNGQLIVDEIYHGLTYDVKRRRRSPGRISCSSSTVFPVLQHDRLAAGLDGRARGLYTRARESRAESLYLSLHAGPICGVGGVLAGDHRHCRRTARGLRRAAQLPAAGITGNRFRLARRAGRRLLLVRRMQPLFRGQSSFRHRSARGDGVRSRRD